MRSRGGGPDETTSGELFFDLVYVFAVTQLSHLVIDGGLSLGSIGHATFILLVIWWAWINMTWMINWFDPASAPVRITLLGAALASLLMSAAIPTAFGDYGLLFAIAYVSLQVGKNIVAFVLVDRDHPLSHNYERVLPWSLLTVPLWIAGGLVDPGLRYALWGPALAIDLAAPLFGYWIPGRGRSQTTDWDIEGSHFAERFQSFLIIVLGESIVITGATASADGLRPQVVLALIAAFVGTSALWWLYFGEVARNSRSHLAGSADVGRLARDAYSYLHLPMVAGIIMAAIADDLLIAHPGDTLETAGVVMMVGGPAVFLGGEILFRLRMVGTLNRKRLATVTALAVLGLAGGQISALALAAAVGAVLILLAVWENDWTEPAPDRGVASSF